jgi:predicted ArsR family transcriptional regulator
MVTRAGMNEVKFKVRLNALLLYEFTAEQMMRITGLKPESVRTELQRMKQEGLLEVTRSPVPTDQKRKRGGQHALYRLVADPEKRLALSRSVETFYPEKPRPFQPTSRHYHRALRLLDKVTNAKDDHECKSLLHEAEEELDFALSEEGDSLAPESVRAYIEFQRGRLAYLREQYERAAASFSLVRRELIAIGQAAEAARVDEFLLCIEVHRQWAADRDRVSKRRIRRLLEVLESSGFQAASPLVQLMTGLLRAWPPTGFERAIDAATAMRDIELIVERYSSSQDVSRERETEMPELTDLQQTSDSDYIPKYPEEVYDEFLGSRRPQYAKNDDS